MQRILDILLSGVALMLLMPLLLPLALILRFSGEGEIFYTQQRVGLGGKPFGLLKFATMLKDSPKIGTGTITIKNDPRVLPLGGLLRKTKINELPQLINIFRGEMSVIGPRPMTLDNFAAYPRDYQRSLEGVRPGLSGIGSIVFRDEEDLLHQSGDARRVHSEVIGPYKAALEDWYVRHRGPRLYFALIGLTVLAVLRPKSRLLWRMLPSLPAPAPELRKLLGL